MGKRVRLPGKDFRWLRRGEEIKRGDMVWIWRGLGKPNWQPWGMMSRGISYNPPKDNNTEPTIKNDHTSLFCRRIEVGESALLHLPPS